MRLSSAYAKSALIPTLIFIAVAGLFVLSLTSMQRSATNSSASQLATTPLTTESANEMYGQVPLSFESNQGQTDKSVDFLARGPGYALFLKPTESVFALRNSKCEQRTDDLSTSPPETNGIDSELDGPSAVCNRQTVLRMKLVGADKTAEAEAYDELPGKVNYFMGDDPSKWRTGVPTHARVRYDEVYPGVDVLYYGNQRQLEYDFIVAPGRDPSVVKLQFEGAEKIEVDRTGDLLLTLGDSVIRQPKPVVYQEAGGTRREVAGEYTVWRGAVSVGFRGRRV